MERWLFGRERRDQGFLTSEVADGDRLNRLRQAMATISPERLNGKDATECAPTVAALLTKVVAGKAGSTLEDDADRVVAGIFVFAFANCFSGGFVAAAPAALLHLLGIEGFERCVSAVQQKYSRMHETGELAAISNTCEFWCIDPSSTQIDWLAELFNIYRNQVAQK